MMVTKQHGLGRGLGALIKEFPVQAPTAPQSTDPAPAAPGEGIRHLPIKLIHPSPFQPRQHFSRETLDELVVSIRERGILQPLLVRKLKDGYELIAGERRLRAATEAGLAEVPALVHNANDHEALELTMIENLQRQDLNIMEEAEGYRTLAEKFAMTQEVIAQRVGKSRPSVANTMRLLHLPLEVRRFISEGLLSPGHAKVLLGVEIAEEQCKLAEKVVQSSLSVRELEKIIEATKRKPRKPREERADIPASHITHLIDMLHQHFGTSIRLTPCRTLNNGKKAKGTLEVDFFSNEELDRILEVLGLTDKG